MAAAWVLALIFASGVTARAEPDVFMRTVGFALTGSDNADLKVIGDRAKCVFAIKNDIFRLNNVHTDRITIQGWQRQQGLEQWVTVELHGDDVVFEETTEPLKDDGSETIRQLRAAMPDAFTSHHNIYKEHELHLTTSDQDRVKTAWRYIYSHGCTGKQSHFKSEVERAAHSVRGQMVQSAPTPHSVLVISTAATSRELNVNKRKRKRSKKAPMVCRECIVCSINGEQKDAGGLIQTTTTQ